MQIAKFKGQEIPVVFNFYVLRMFGKAVGEDLPSGAIEKLMKIGKDNSFEVMDISANLFFEMVKAAAEIKGIEVHITLAEAYDIMREDEAMSAMSAEIADFWPDAVTLKKNKAVKEE